MASNHQSRTITATEPAEPPPIGALLAFGAMLPIAAGAIYLWIGGEAQSFLTVNMTLLWGAAILTFLAGARRGVSFRQPGGPTLSQLVTMLWVFGLGFGAIVATVWAYTLTATALEIVGYLSLAVLDPIAAKNGEAPLFFASLRPIQMTIPIVALLALGVYVWQSPLFG
ncbi:DUF3429 domain-containing protein [Aurantimonas sp. 22II-16-19i]|uniref:DUF3429 domain-containing protein n=1 Tax=Aurantimonas sp. 22II-16-19i TaxID=1317114 RepID=UPI0009F7DF0C|nr:DUF3429 domain-containing protein [Aurantimonas sp. 22II-16-19i]ORE97307.1 hypothetical protein ATO4_09656 [Aurantimonas sp. 22II-16-19i]